MPHHVRQTTQIAQPPTAPLPPSTGTPDYLVTVLAKAREKLADAEARMSDARRQFENEHATLIAEIADLKSVCDETAQALRMISVAYFEATGNKKLHPAVTVVSRKSVDVDAHDALVWAVQYEAKRIAENASHEPTMITLNKRAWNKLAKAALDAGLVVDPPVPGSMVTVPAATIKTDLSDYVK